MITKHKHELEAENSNLKLLDHKTDNPNYKRYRFIGCGHEQNLQPTHVRNGTFKCKSCSSDHLLKNLTELNLEYVAETEDVNVIVVKSKNCGHVFNKRKNNLQSYFHCKVCFNQSLVSAAEENGLVYVGKSSKGNQFKTYQFKECLHFQDISYKSIGSKTKCQTCYFNTLSNDAEKRNIKLLQNLGNYFNLYELQCGCIKKIRTDHVRNNNFCCENCNDTHLNKESNVYLIKMSGQNTEFLKLGVAKSIVNRSSNYCFNGSKETVCVKNFNTAKEALFYERTLHSKYKKFLLDKDVMKQYMKNGYTECYPVSLIETLKEELK